jgi:hypothetical protein
LTNPKITTFRETNFHPLLEFTTENRWLACDVKQGLFIAGVLRNQGRFEKKGYANLAPACDAAVANGSHCQGAFWPWLPD